MAPIAGPCFESWWADWCIGQVGTLTLRWLCREAVRRSGGALALDEETLEGRFHGRPVQAWSPPAGLRPTAPAHGQVNWLGLRSDGRVMAVVWNDGAAGPVSCSLSSRDVGGADIRPMAVHRPGGGENPAAWDGRPVRLGAGAMVVLEWEVRR
jgi:hypothetical protein